MSATKNILMVRPSKFNFNNQTSKSNFFQKNIFECENELNGTVNENECYISETYEYTISDSLYFVADYDWGTINDGYEIDIDGAIATLKRIDYEYLQSVLIELTRQ